MGRKSNPKSVAFNSPFQKVRDKLFEYREFAPVHVPSSPGGMCDEELFNQAMKDVVPISGKEKRAALHHTAPLASTTCPCPDSVESIQKLFDLIQGNEDFDPAHSDEYILWRSPDLNPLAFERLRSGAYPIQAFIDLHRLRADEGEEAARRFLWDSYISGLCCVLIIHGKGNNSRGGEPVLKRRVASWLRTGVTGKIVLAFSSAQSRDGGLGALYVLLSPSGKVAAAEKTRTVRKTISKLVKRRDIRK